MNNSYQLYGIAVFHTTLVVLEAMAVLERLLPNTIVRKNHVETTLVVSCLADPSTATKTLDLLSELEPYMYGWSQFRRDKEIHHFGPEKLV